MRLIVESIRHPSQEEMLPGWGWRGGGPRVIQFKNQGVLSDCPLYLSDCKHH